MNQLTFWIPTQIHRLCMIHDQTMFPSLVDATPDLSFLDSSVETIEVPQGGSDRTGVLPTVQSPIV